jgi:hypothetical protein
MKTAHRKASRAKHATARPTAWIDAVAASKPPPEHHATTVVNRVRTAFEALKNGTSDCAHFDRLAACINVGLIRSEAIDPLCEQTMKSAIVAMGNADAIYGRHRKYGFYGPDLEAIADAVDLYEEILRNSTPHQMEDAVQESARRMIEQVKQERKVA